MDRTINETRQLSVVDHMKINRHFNLTPSDTSDDTMKARYEETTESLQMQFLPMILLLNQTNSNCVFTEMTPQQILELVLTSNSVQIVEELADKTRNIYLQRNTEGDFVDVDWVETLKEEARSQGTGPLTTISTATKDALTDQNKVVFASFQI